MEKYLCIVWICNGILHLANIPQLVWRQVLLCPDWVVVPSLTKVVQIVLQTRQEHIMTCKNVCGATEVQIAFIFQCVKYVVKYIGHCHPHVSPQLLNPEF